MNILLVDDDYYVIAALQKKIDWKMLNIETVYTANNVAQAQEILEKHSVQILISDIEMPQGADWSFWRGFVSRITVFKPSCLPIMLISIMRRRPSNCKVLSIFSSQSNLTS